MDKINTEYQKKRKLKTDFFKENPEITLRVDNKTIKRNIETISLSIGSEIEAWEKNKIIGIMIVKEGNSDIVINEYTTSDWILKKLHVHLQLNEREKFVSIVKEQLKKGIDVYKILSKPEIAGWLVEIQKREKDPVTSGIGIGSSIGNFPPFQRVGGWRKLKEIPSKFEEASE